MHLCDTSEGSLRSRAKSSPQHTARDYDTRCLGGSSDGSVEAVMEGRPHRRPGAEEDSGLRQLALGYRERCPPACPLGSTQRACTRGIKALHRGRADVDLAGADTVPAAALEIS